MSISRRSFVQTAGLTALASASSAGVVSSNTVIAADTQSSKGATTMALPDKADYLRVPMRLLNQQWPNNRLVNIICHGHSVPAGYFKTPLVDTFNAYPHLLHRAIKAVYPYCVSNVIVTAIGGETSQSGAARFESQVLCHRPDVITIDYALNDRGLGLEPARTAWVSMINQAIDARAKVILLTPTPDMDHTPDDPDEPLNQHAQQIRELAEEYQIGLVDSLAGFDAYQKETGNVSDLLSQINHPNRQGHDIVARELFSWFSSEPFPTDVEEWGKF